MTLFPGTTPRNLLILLIEITAFDRCSPGGKLALLRLELCPLRPGPVSRTLKDGIVSILCSDWADKRKIGDRDDDPSISTMSRCTSSFDDDKTLGDRLISGGHLSWQLHRGEHVQ